MEEERENDAVAAGSSYRMRVNNFPQAESGVSFVKKHLQSKSVSYILNRQSSFPVREDNLHMRARRRLAGFFCFGGDWK
ncbi:MAG: hypothetical protein E7199_00165 [Schwartzia succinivorans]|nr:hypothetical protein [Schwartzia succinivorans]